MSSASGAPGPAFVFCATATSHAPPCFFATIVIIPNRLAGGIHLDSCLLRSSSSNERPPHRISGSELLSRVAYWWTLESGRPIGGVVLFEVGFAMKPSPTNCDKVDVLRHDGCQLVAIVFRPRITERVRKSTERLFVAFG